MLFSAFCGSAERTLRDEGEAGFTPLNDLCLCGEKLNRDKKIVQKQGEL